MQRNERVKRLTLHSCYYEEHISDILASSLPSMNLQALSLHDINIASDGWPYLFRNIMNCTELTQLDLSWNELNESTVHFLAKSIVAQRKISRLSLSSCSLDDNCIKELAKGLRYHFALESLDISRNQPSEERGVSHLKELLLFNTSIVKLNVEGCGLDIQTLYEFESRLRYNNSYLRNFCSLAVFDVFDVITSNPQVGKKTKAVHHKVDELTPVSTATEERDADETNSQAEEEERS